MHQEVAERGAEVASAAIDVAQRADVQRLVDLAAERFGYLDVLIKNAGVMPIGPLGDLAVDDWEHRSSLKELEGTSIRR